MNWVSRSHDSYSIALISRTPANFPCVSVLLLTPLHYYCLLNTVFFNPRSCRWFIGWPLKFETVSPHCWILSPRWGHIFSWWNFNCSWLIHLWFASPTLHLCKFLISSHLHCTSSRSCCDRIYCLWTMSFLNPNLGIFFLDLDQRKIIQMVTSDNQIKIGSIPLLALVLWNIFHFSIDWE